MIGCVSSILSNTILSLTHMQSYSSYVVDLRNHTPKIDSNIWVEDIWTLKLQLANDRSITEI